MLHVRKNGNAFFNANITYDQDKQINRIILNTEGNQFTDNYIIVRAVSTAHPLPSVNLEGIIYSSR